jgi:hypothetical protein
MFCYFYRYTACNFSFNLIFSEIKGYVIPTAAFLPLLLRLRVCPLLLTLPRFLVSYGNQVIINKKVLPFLLLITERFLCACKDRCLRPN